MNIALKNVHNRAVLYTYSTHLLKTFYQIKLNIINLL